MFCGEGAQPVLNVKKYIDSYEKSVIFYIKTQE